MVKKTWFETHSLQRWKDSPPKSHSSVSATSDSLVHNSSLELFIRLSAQTAAEENRLLNTDGCVDSGINRYCAKVISLLQHIDQNIQFTRCLQLSLCLTINSIQSVVQSALTKYIYDMIY